MYPARTRLNPGELLPTGMNCSVLRLRKSPDVGLRASFSRFMEAASLSPNRLLLLAQLKARHTVEPLMVPSVEPCPAKFMGVACWPDRPRINDHGSLRKGLPPLSGRTNWRFTPARWIAMMLPLFWVTMAAPVLEFWNDWGTSRLMKPRPRKAVRNGSPLIQGSVKVRSIRPPYWP